MPKSAFYNTSVVPSSRYLPRVRSRIPLSKEVRAVLRASRQQASEKYQEALHGAYGGFEQQIKDIAGVHNKSIQRVRSDLHMGPQVSMKRHSRKNAWNAFCWKKSREEGCRRSGKQGKEVLQDLVQNPSTKQEYAALTKEEKENLVLELEKEKATKSKGFRSSARSRINDVTKTLGLLENEIDKLRSRSGIEAMLFMTRGSTDTPLNSVSFATPGVEEFLGTALNIDNHALLTQMEGFAIQGLKGTASNYKQMIARRRSEIRSEIGKQLRSITGNKDAQMEWKYYPVKVVARYHVIIEGWPTDRVPFKNLSVASSPLADLDMLLQRWQDGTTYWKTLTSDEVDDYVNKLKAKGEFLKPPPRRTRSDRGKKRKQSTPSNTEEGSANHTTSDRAKKRKRQSTPSDTENDSDSPLAARHARSKKHKQQSRSMTEEESDSPARRTRSKKRKQQSDSAQTTNP